MNTKSLDAGIVLDVTFVIGLDARKIKVNSAALASACPIYTASLFDPSGNRRFEHTMYRFHDCEYEDMGHLIMSMYTLDYTHVNRTLATRMGYTAALLFLDNLQ